MTLVREGGCMCGAIRFRAEGAPLWVANCHCDACRKQTASPFTAYAGFRPEAVRFSGAARAVYESSPGVRRSFCANCGTPLAYESVRWPDEIHLFVCAFDDANGFAPRAHVYVKDQVGWVQLADKLPRYLRTSADGPPV